jgi:hypothetical protein
MSPLPQGLTDAEIVAIDDKSYRVKEARDRTANQATKGK